MPKAQQQNPHGHAQASLHFAVAEHHRGKKNPHLRVRGCGHRIGGESSAIPVAAAVPAPGLGLHSFPNSLPACASEVEAGDGA